MQSGIHEWRITSYSLDNEDTVFTVLETKYDTLNSTYLPTREPVIVNDSSEIQIIVSPHSIKYNWWVYLGPKTYSTPNNTYIDTYPLVIYDTWIVSKYDDNGPIYHSYDRSAGHFGEYHETYKLLEYIR